MFSKPIHKEVINTLLKFTGREYKNCILLAIVFMMAFTAQSFSVGDLSNKVISAISNYPNPFDSRSEKTTLTYVLNQDYEVRIRIYDLFGFKVFEVKRGAGSSGGQSGLNRIVWDGRNNSGQKVSKGGYVAIIQVSSDRIVTAKRKIGVIH